MKKELSLNKQIRLIITAILFFPFTYFSVQFIVNISAPEYRGKYFVYDSKTIIHLHMPFDNNGYFSNISRKIYPAKISIIINGISGDNSILPTAEDLGKLELNSYPQTSKRRFFNMVFPAELSINENRIKLKDNYISTAISFQIESRQKPSVFYRGLKVPLELQNMRTVNMTEKDLPVDLNAYLSKNYQDLRQVNIYTPKASFSILAIGHFYNYFFFDNDKKDEIETAIKNISPDLLVFLGDSIVGPKECNKFDLVYEQWKTFESVIQRLSIPAYTVPGNHDGSSTISCLVTRMEDGWNRYRLPYSVMKVYSDSWEYFAGFLNSSGYYLPSYQIEHFNFWAQKSSDAKRLVFVHHQRANNIYKVAAGNLLKGTVVLSGDNQSESDNEQFTENGIIFQNTTAFRKDHIEFLEIVLSQNLIMKRREISF